MKTAIAAIGAVMFGLPLAAVRFAPGDAGMAICFVLFFAVNPVLSLYVGICSGMAVKRRWFLPIVNAAAFLLGVWTIFDWGNPDFCVYTAIYFVIGAVSALVTHVVTWNRQKKQSGHKNT